LRIDRHPELATVTQTNCHIMTRHQQVFENLLHTPVPIRGYTDLALDGRKFSGNAQRRRHNVVLFHGSLLLNFDLPIIETLLPTPSQQPAYRASRSHLDFVRNLPLAASDIKSAFRAAWQAEEALQMIPNGRVSQLIDEKYGRPDWNDRF
jgi:lipoate-protein ligase A